MAPLLYRTVDRICSPWWALFDGKPSGHLWRCQHWFTGFFRIEMFSRSVSGKQYEVMGSTPSFRPAHLHFFRSKCYPMLWMNWMYLRLLAFQGWRVESNKRWSTNTKHHSNKHCYRFGLPGLILVFLIGRMLDIANKFLVYCGLCSEPHSCESCFYPRNIALWLRNLYFGGVLPKKIKMYPTSTQVLSEVTFIYIPWSFMVSLLIIPLHQMCKHICLRVHVMYFGFILMPNNLQGICLRDGCKRMDLGIALRYKYPDRVLQALVHMYHMCKFTRNTTFTYNPI